jgi:hypothetical protein
MHSFFPLVYILVNKRNDTQTLLRRFWQSGNTRDLQHSGRPRVTLRQQDNHIRLVDLRDRFRTSSLTARSIPGLRPINSRTVRNRVRDHHVRPRRPAIRQIVLPRLTWCRQVVTYMTRSTWSSVVLLECDVVRLSVDELNNTALNNFIPIACSGQISDNNN